MRPVRVSIDVPQQREAVFDFLDLLANHERFTDHMLRDWRFEGPPRGVGAKVRLNAVVARRTDPIVIEVIEVEAPERSVERNVGAGGRRVATGTYTLEALPDGGTRVAFSYAWERAPLSERLAAPLIRALMRRGNARAMRRLAAELRGQAAGPSPR